MNVSIKIDPETLFLLHKIISKSAQMIANTRVQKAEKSMRVELFGIISKRCITYSTNPKGKSLTLTLKYHLADIIWNILDAVQWSYGMYEFNKIEMLKNQLHQILL